MPSVVRILIRMARPTDFASAVDVETAADALLIELLDAMKWPAVTSAEERMALPGFMLVAEDEASAAVVGFVHVIEVEGFAHLEQLSVLPRHGRQGYGRMLVKAALTEIASRGYSEVTLRTYVRVPWNAPFYETCGFVRSEASSPFHRRLAKVESRIGLDQYGERIQMTMRLPSSEALMK